MLLLLVGAAAYQPSLSAPFILDDEEAILDNHSIRRLWPPWEALRPPRETAVSGRPIANLSFAVNYAVGGLRPEGYHLVNLVLHLLAALTLYGIVRRTSLLPRWGEATQRAAPWLALGVALLWEVHPLLTDAVTYLSQRTELLMGWFLLLTLYGAIRAAAAFSPTRWNALAIVSCWLGMASKEVMVIAPVLVVLYDRVFLLPSWRQMLRQRRSLYLGLASSWLLLGALAAEAPHGDLAGFSVTHAGMTPWRYALTQCGVVVHYLRLAVWPHPLVLDYYDWPLAQRLGEVWPAVVLIGGLTAATGWALLRRAWLGFLGAWFLLILAPTSSIIPIPTEVVAERRMYLPLIACVVLIVAGGWRLLHRLPVQDPVRRLLTGMVVLGAVALLGFQTIRRNDLYRSEVAIWRDTVAKRPHNARAYHNLGVVLVKKGRLDEAVAQFAKALALAPHSAITHHNVAGALVRQGKVEEALVHATEAVRLAPGHLPYYDGVADLLVRQGSGAAEDLHDQGILLFQQGRAAEAITYFQAALRLRPDAANIQNSLAVVFMQVGLTEEAEAHLVEALRLDPHHAEAHHNLANLMRRQGHVEEALVHYTRALELMPDAAAVHNNLGVLLAQQGRLEEAVAAFRRALELSPAYPEARRNLDLATQQIP
jgi:Flp pilus assembly protein TadD